MNPNYAIFLSREDSKILCNTLQFFRSREEPCLRAVVCNTLQVCLLPKESVDFLSTEP
uniref:Uncharacterized protein n=1 Tax=Nelumbo nucifera TaxID=4432 RepID=A0A822ZLS5_NELNU|nr:TPA_asm: hypothetical protein HUJ06_004077 [Nelumbo nucifera]